MRHLQLPKRFRNEILQYLGLPLLIFISALAPRLLFLDTFITYDEYDQLSFAARFLQSVLAKNWAGALILGYPGVPTMALGALGLWSYYQAKVWDFPALFEAASRPASDLPAVSQTSLEYTHHVFLPLILNSKPQMPDLNLVLDTVTQNPLMYIEAVRLPLIVVACITLTIIYLLLGRLLDFRLAFAATLLISFNPLLLALSTIIHVDAPLSYFMFASFIAFILYLDKGNWWMLGVSGLFGALAVLSKTPALIMGPILVATGVIYTLLPPVEFSRAARFAANGKNEENEGNTPQVPRDQSAQVRRRRLVTALLGWGIVAAIAFVAFWPSMWARPLFALEWIIQNIVQNTQQTRSGSGVFWGYFNSDRNPFYYTYAFPFRWTPLTTIGVLASLAMLIAGYQARRRSINTFAARVLPLALSLQAFTVIFIATISIISRRSARYTLPAMFPVELVAILGLAWLLQWLTGKIPRLWRSVLALLLVLQIGLVLTYHPYYYTYFNPLLGGYRTAPYLVNMGLGEGLDAAARYLNHEPGAASSTTASWFIRQFEPFYKGESVEIFDVSEVVAADHTVFYITQIQLGFPTPELLGYFNHRLPEKIIALGGIDYAWIYPGPIIGKRAPADLTSNLNIPFGGAVTLLGLDLSKFPLAESQKLSTLQSPLATAPLPLAHRSSLLPITLYWQTTGSLPPDLNVSIRVVDKTGLVWGQVDRLPIGGLVRTDRWRPGEVIRDEYILSLDPAIPPGDYTFDILLYNFETGEVFGQVDRVGELTVTPARAPVELDALTIAHPLRVELGPEFYLLGHTLEQLETLPGYQQSFKLYWQARRQLETDLAASLIARHSTGAEITLLTRPLGPAEYPTSRWLPGQAMAEVYTFAFPLEALPGDYELLVRVNASTEEVLGKVILLEQPRLFDLPVTAQSLEAKLGAEQGIRLIGYELNQAADTLDLTLYWQPLQTPAEEYKVFVHISDADETIVAQQDAIPAGGARPTLTWFPGEIIADTYHFSYETPGFIQGVWREGDGGTPPTAPRAVGGSLPPGQYIVWVGMYNPTTGQRLPAASEIAPVLDNRIRLLTFDAPGP